VGVTIAEGEGAIWGETCARRAPLWIANWTGPCSGTRQWQTLDCKRWTSLLPAAKWGLGLQTAGEVWYLRLRCLTILAYC